MDKHKIKNIEPIQYFSDYPLNESLIIDLEFDLSKKNLIITYDFAAEAVSYYFSQRAKGIRIIEPLPRGF